MVFICWEFPFKAADHFAGLRHVAAAAPPFDFLSELAAYLFTMAVTLAAFYALERLVLPGVLHSDEEFTRELVARLNRVAAHSPDVARAVRKLRRDVRVV